VSLDRFSDSLQGGFWVARSGSDHSDFCIHFHENKDHIFDFALRMLGDKQAAGDITQDVFMKLFENRNRIREIQNIRGWLFISARNMCLNHLRDRRKVISMEEIDQEHSNDSAGDNPQLGILKKAMAELDDRFREAVILREFQGFSYSEMAEILQITVSAVRSLLFNARIRLRENYEKIEKARLI